MPKQDQSDQNQKPKENMSSVPFSPQADLPPMPPDFLNIASEQSKENPISDKNGFSASSQIPDINNIVSSPQKKFGSGKIIATILGILMLVGGLGAGTYLVGQKQIFNQKAESVTCDSSVCPRCACGCTASSADQCAVSNSCKTDCYTATPASSSRPNTCEENGFTCVDAETCPVYGSSQKGTCVKGVCCYVASEPSPTTKSGWGIGKACYNHSSSTGAGCILITCPNGCNNVDSNGNLTGCSESAPGATVTYLSGNDGCEKLSSQVSSVCGQVDLVDSSHTYCQSDGTFTDAQIHCPASSCTPTKTSTPKPTSTPISTAPYCAAITTYDSSWNLISASARSSLTAGTTINFCVSGAAPSGTFSGAKFTINGTTYDKTTTQRSGSTDYCQSYTIPSGVTTVKVTAQILYSDGNWY